MAKEVDFPVSETYKLICIGSAIVCMFMYYVSLLLFSEMGAVVSFVVDFVNILFIVSCLGAFVYIYVNKESSQLSNYFVLMIPTVAFFLVPMTVNLLLFNVLIDPIPSNFKAALFFLVLFYIFHSVKKSIFIIENNPAVSDIYNAGFFECDGKVIMRKSNLVKVDETINKYPFKFIEAASLGVPFIMTLGWAMVGGLYKLTPSPELTIRAFLGLLSFLATPAMIFMVVYGIYLNYIIPKRVYGERWKEIWREVE